MTGIRYDLGTHSTVSAGYRYFATADPEYQVFGIAGATFTGSYEAHNFNVGYAFKF